MGTCTPLCVRLHRRTSADSLVRGDILFANRSVNGGWGSGRSWLWTRLSSLRVEESQAGLPRQREPHRIRGPDKHDEERIPWLVNFFSLREAPQQLAEVGMMVLNQRDGLGVAQVLLEFDRADDVGEEKREHRRAMFALKGLDLLAMLGCQRQIHAFLWDCGCILGFAGGLASRRAHGVVGSWSLHPVRSLPPLLPLPIPILIAILILILLPSPITPSFHHSITPAPEGRICPQMLPLLPSAEPCEDSHKEKP